MMRRLMISAVALGFLACGGQRAPKSTNQGGQGGQGGDAGTGMTDTEGTGGSLGGSSAGGGGSGGSSGSGGSAGTGDTGGTSGTGGVGGDSGAGGSEADAAPMTMSMDGPSMSVDAGRTEAGNPGGDTLPGKPWIHLCPKSATHEECCMFLCSCLSTVCADSPLDKSGVMNCMTNCPKLSDMLLRCHVYHCYESQNPNVPQDHASHCGHASGRVGGGGCPTAVYQ